MKTVDLTPLYRNSIGYDRLAGLLDGAFRSGSAPAGFPPYNIEVLDDNRYTITLAVAGFSDNDIAITVERGVLSVRGEKLSKDEQHNYLYQGIAPGGFERKFNLAEFVEVSGATLENGILTINLEREVPEEMKPRRIEINSNTTSNVIQHKQKQVA